MNKTSLLIPLRLLSTVLVSRAVSTNTTKECQTNLLAYENYCFQIVEEAKRWTSANDDCKFKNGHLAILSSEQLYNFVNSILMEKPESKEKGYWIGASDIQYESDFTWLDGTRVNFTKWFHGWAQFDYYNKQPNDDGLSGQNCLEIRRKFSFPSKGFGYANEFHWNDMNCARAKPYICQFLKAGSAQKAFPHEVACNDTIFLTSTVWHATIYSPNYPSNYGDFLDCFITINVPEKSWMIIEFTKFFLEPETDLKCEYDYLRIWEEAVVDRSWVVVKQHERACGDWSFQLKLMRKIISSPKTVLHFHTDHSRGFGGYHANIYFEDSSHRRSINICNNKKLRNFGNHCYLFISFPKVEWQTASQICRSSGGLLASALSKSEESYIVDQILRSPEYTNDDVYWFGGKRSEDNVWTWEDGNDFNYTDWVDSSSSTNVTLEIENKKNAEGCLSLQQQFQASDQKANSFWWADRPYWNDRDCKSPAGYICKLPKPIISEGENLSIVLEEPSGVITLPSFPNDYPNNFDYMILIIAQPKTRILVTFTLIDTEYQEHCLYDYIKLQTHSYDIAKTYCGHKEKDLPNFASYSNQSIITFHSDYSISATGFSAEYQVVNISNCMVDTSEPFGFINSVNFPHFYLNALDCETTLRTDVNSRILLDFIFFDVGELKHMCFDTDYVAIHLDGDNGRRTPKLCGHLNTANESRNMLYISYGNVVKLFFHSDAHIWGAGYRAWYQTLTSNNYTQHILLKPNETTELKSINYPRSYPPDLCIDVICRVPYGYQILIIFDELNLVPELLPDNVIFLNNPVNYSSTNFAANFSYLSPWNRLSLRYCGYDDQKSATRRFKAFVTAALDPVFWTEKVFKNYTGIIDACYPSPCYNEAECIESDLGPSCRCSPSYLGTFCHFSYCDYKPCVHGSCLVTNEESDKYYCQCDIEYTGKSCEFQIHPCASNPCQNGDCHESLGEFTCMCFDGYKGDFCEKKALFEAKTLRESFLRDPFWLGLFMILGVMSSVGIVNCCRKRWSDTKMALLCNPQTPRNDRRLQYEEEKEVNVNTSRDEVCSDDDDSEVYFNFTDIGIDPCQYSSLLQLGDVNFKMKLSDLTEEQLDTLENYLENYLKSCENNSKDEQTDRNIVVENADDPETGILVDLESPRNKINKQLLTPTSSVQKADGALNLAFDSITDLILRSAEIVRPNNANSIVPEESPKQRHSVGGAEHLHKTFLTRKSDTESRLLESKQSKQKFRTAAHRAMSLVKRPQSVEISRESHEEMKRLYYRGASSFSIGRTTAQPFDEESCA